LTYVNVKGPAVADFLDEKRKEIQARLKELKPLVDEYQRLEAAEQALSGVGGSSSTSTTTASAPTRRRRRRSSSASSNGRRGRPRGSGTRAAQALQLVSERPGITIPELASAMGIKQNYLYRVMPGLAEEGKVTKSGRGWHLRG
jgi:CRP-like cAMP-binding protein